MGATEDADEAGGEPVPLVSIAFSEDVPLESIAFYESLFLQLCASVGSGGSANLPAKLKRLDFFPQGPTIVDRSGEQRQAVYCMPIYAVA
jgi:hypothetical protein